MISELSLGAESFVAYATGEDLPTFVYFPHVPLSYVPRTELFPTHQARVYTIIGSTFMACLVPIQRIQDTKGLPANVTNVWFLTRVDSFVC